MMHNKEEYMQGSLVIKLSFTKAYVNVWCSIIIFLN